MAMRQIRKHPEDLLRKTSKPVKKIDDRILVLLDDMKETMISANGLGLAAPQVGVLKRIVVIEIEDQLFELINPVMIESSGTQMRSEACLSVPGKTGVVERPAHVKIKAQNRLGEEITLEGDELFAVALCHEMDHLDGVLFIDKAVEIFDASSEDDFEDDEEEYR
jgi:peptide deformylase